MPSTKAIKHLRTDPAMARAIDKIGPMKLQPMRLSTFQSLTRAIIHQQLSGKAAATITTRFQALFNAEGFPEAEAVLAIAQDRLTSAGLSRNKCGYILDIAQRTVSGELPLLAHCDDITDAELIERLTSVKGIGRWTAEMMLIFNLGRPDVLPVHDLGIRKGFQVIYNKRKMPEPEALDKFGARWAPYRTTASWYLWRAADFLKKGDW
jgi:DNA-3-methyladenine glycosylase II